MDLIKACLHCIENPSPSFHKLLITHSSSNQGFESIDVMAALDEACSEVAQACAGKNIEFEYSYSFHYPSLSDDY